MNMGPKYRAEQEQDQKSNVLSCVLPPQGQYTFNCPALTVGTVPCGAVWDYTEVRRLALLTEEEMLDFEMTLGRLAAAQFCDFKAVSGLIMCPEKEKTRQNVSYFIATLLSSSQTVPWL